jgi:hypothetical protein
LTWEWKRRPIAAVTNSISDGSSFIDGLRYGMEGPVRSFASIVPTMIFYKFIKVRGWDSSWMVSRGPVFLNAILVAAPTDWAVWYLSRWLIDTSTTRTTSAPQKCSPQQPNRWNRFVFNYAVYCSLSNWFNAYALIRTYSNSLETVLTTLSVALVSPVRSIFSLSSWYILRSIRNSPYAMAILTFIFTGITVNE